MGDPDTSVHEQITITHRGEECKINLYAATDFISNYIRWTGKFFEAGLLEYILDNHGDQKTVLDIGANIGNHSLFFSKFLRCEQVIAFEPMANNIELFLKNLAGQEKCKLFSFALSDRSGSVPIFNTEQGNHGGYSLSSEEKGTNSFLVAEQIPTRALDELEVSDVTLIKMDVESHEVTVLRGARKTIARCRPVIFLENNYHSHPAVHPDPNPHAEIFAELGYSLAISNVVGSCMDVWVPKH